MEKTIFVIKRDGAIVAFRKNFADVIWNFETEKQAQECADQQGDVVEPMKIVVAWDEGRM